MPAWNGFVGVLESCATFEAILQRCQAEAIRREQQKDRRSTSCATSSGRTAAAFNTEQMAGKGNTKSKRKRDRSKGKCFSCNQMGHYARNCAGDPAP